MTNREWAQSLTLETGFDVRWMRSCFWMHDGQDAWLPLYTPTDVRRVVARVKAKRNKLAQVQAAQIGREGDAPNGICVVSS